MECLPFYHQETQDSFITELMNTLAFPKYSYTLLLHFSRRSSTEEMTATFLNMPVFVEVAEDAV